MITKTLLKLRRSHRRRPVLDCLEIIRHTAERSILYLSNRRVKSILLISDFKEYNSEMQYAPFETYRQSLRNDSGIVSLNVSVDTAKTLLKISPLRFDVIGLKFGFREPDSIVNSLVEKIQSLAKGARLVLFDGDDDLNFQRKELVDKVDLILKKHVHTNSTEYNRNWVGKTNLTDWVHHNFDISFIEDQIPTTDALSEDQAAKIQLGYNISLDYKITDLLDRLRTLPQQPRNIDVLCRAPADPKWWIYPLRQPVSDRLNPLVGRYTILTPDERVDQDAYYQEMLSSKICVSPFGYGEICWRDFEAVLCGCLLIKPDMGHVKTEPDIYKPFDTYVPVDWRYENLEDVCVKYLKDDTERQRIANNARQQLFTYLDTGAVKSVIENLVSQRS